MKLFRSAYDWVLHWAATPYALPALLAISFVESSFFPIPPDILLIAMTVAVPALWVRYSLFCSIASVLGSIWLFHWLSVYGSSRPTNCGLLSLTGNI